MKRFILLLVLLGLAEYSTAQGVFKFSEESYDFGKIMEGDPAVHEFRFKNVGDQPIVLGNVRASCGCTTPKWTREPVLPGDEGIIKASYSSRGRPGNFNKSITISSNATTPTKVLYIKGFVERPIAQPSYTEEQLAASPRITVEKTEYNVGTIEKGQNLVKRINIKNTGKENLVIKDIRSTCNCVSFLSSPPTILPGNEQTIEVAYVPNAVKEGKEVIYIYSNDLVNPKFSLVFKTKVVEQMGGMSIMQGSQK